MPEFSDVQKYFNAPTKSLLRQAWQVVPEKQRTEIYSMLQGIPLNKNPLNSLIDLALINSKAVLGDHKKVAIIGPANVGKSTLFNQFVRAKTDQAEVSPIPGTTRVNQEADAGIFTMIDTPGADAVGAVGQTEREHALAAAGHADFLIWCSTPCRGQTNRTRALRGTAGAEKAFHHRAEQIDLVEKFKEDVLEKIAANLNVAPEQVIPISALKGDGIGQVTHGDHRRRLSHDARAGKSDAGIPSQDRLAQHHHRLVTLRRHRPDPPAGDRLFAAEVATQTGMVLTIARILPIQDPHKRARELIGTFGMGMLGGALFQQLSKFAAVPGWILSQPSRPR